jgi:mannitol-specific phosphotransferase system IIBC component
MPLNPLRERDYVVAWVLFLLVGGVGGAVLGGLAGGVIGTVATALGIAVGDVIGLIRVAGGIAGLAMSYLAFRYIVNQFIGRKIKAADR